MTRSLRSLWLIIFALAVSFTGGGLARAAGTPAAGTPVAGAIDCTVLYEGRFSNPVPTPAPGSACVNIITGSPDAPAVDVYVGGVKVVTNQAYAADVVNNVFAVSSGKPLIQVVATGDSLDKALLAKKVTLAPGAAYDLVLYDVAALMKVRAYQVDLSPLPADGSRVRVINATNDQGTIVAYIVQGPNNILQAVATKSIKVGRYSPYIELTWTAEDDNDLTVYEGPEGTMPDNDTGHDSYESPGNVSSFILVGQNGRVGNWVRTRWMAAAA